MTQSSKPRSATTPAADNIKAIVELERQAAREATFPERLSVAISSVIGSVAFLTAYLAVIVAWIIWNVEAPEPFRFDPYPFPLLAFVVSLGGILIATFVLIAQNRLSRQSDQRDHLNLQISLLAEQEMTLMLKLLRRVADTLHVPAETGDEARVAKLAEDTDVHELVAAIRREMPDKDDS